MLQVPLGVSTIALCHTQIVPIRRLVEGALKMAGIDKGFQ